MPIRKHINIKQLLNEKKFHKDNKESRIIYIKETQIYAFTKRHTDPKVSFA